MDKLEQAILIQAKLILAKDRLRRKLDECVERDGCLLWVGKPDTEGYGRFYFDRTSRKAHNAVYELLVGAIPPGLELDHLCGTRNCVKVKHLEPVTHRENVLRGDGLAAVNARRTYCVNGHEFVGDNIIVTKPNKYHAHPTRRCRACKNIENRARKQRIRVDVA